VTANSSLAWAKNFPPKVSFAARGDARDELLDFFRRVFEARQSDPTSQIVTLAISRIAERTWRGPEWELAQDLMSQAVVSDTGAMQQYVRTLLRLRMANSENCEPARLKACLSEVIIRHAPRGHGSEVAWAVWACMAFDVTLSGECATLISQMTDDVVALLALELESRGGFAQKLEKKTWMSFMTADQLRRDHWLLAYEAYERGWLHPSGADYVAADSAFSWLRANKVRFLKRFRAPTPRTVGHIRATSSGYEDDE
jgi:hypothetical protein